MNKIHVVNLMKKCSFPVKFVLIFRGHNICHTWKDTTEIKGAADKHGDVADRCKRSLTALFTKPPVGMTPQPPAPFMAYGSFRNCTRQNHGTAGNREAGGFVNSAVTALFAKPLSSVLPAVGTTSETIPATSSIEGFRDGMVEQWNSTRQYHGTAENREAGEFVNSAVKQRLFWFYSAIHKAAGSLVTGRSLQNGKMSMGNRRTERPPGHALYGDRPSGGFVNSAVNPENRLPPE